MGNSIQEFAKKINSRLSVTDCLSIFLTSLIVGIFASYIHMDTMKNKLPVTYEVSDVTKQGSFTVSSSETRPFASVQGKTYTFSWCQGSSRIKILNRVYFSSEIEAKQSGRALSLLCKK